MAELIRGIEPATVRRNLERVRERAGEGVRVLIATKYVAAEDLPLLSEAGVDLVGENRVQDLAAKQAEHSELFEWHFIGTLQSRKAVDVANRVSLIHSLGSESARAKLERFEARNPPDVLVQVNVAREEGKAGIDPSALGEFIAACPLRVAGLMTMPPFAERAEDSRRHFAALAELAAEHGLSELSMGTTQDWEVAVEEGATVIRLGSGVLKP